MARVKDLWWSEVKDPADPTRKIKQKTKRHPDRGGSKTAKRWLAVWIAPDGKEETKAFRIQDAAKKHARQQEEDIERGEYIDAKSGKQLLGPVGRKWLKLRTVGGASRIKYERTLRLHIEPTFAHRQVKSPRPSEIAEWLLELGETHGESVQEQALFILRGTFKLAVADGMRKDNPATSEIIPKPQREEQAEEREVWTTDRTWSVIAAHPEEYQLIPTLLAGCGLREGEAFGVGEEDFDFAAGKLHIRRQLTQVGKLWVYKLPKGGRERVVPLSPGVSRAAQAFIKAYPPRSYVLPWMKENGRIDADPYSCKLMFRWHGDHPLTHDKHIRPRSYERSVWVPALAVAGVIPMPEPGPKGGLSRSYAAPKKGDGTHALRHWCSTTLQDANDVSLAAVMDFLGHSRKNQRRLPVTVRVYGHVTEEAFEAARVAIDRTLFRLRPVQDQPAAGTVAERAAAE